MIFTSHSTEETEKIAYDIASAISEKCIITLDGDLGAGKTAFVRGIGRGLGVTDRVSSPTFTIVNEYRTGRMPLLHFDVYRIMDSDEMYDIGWEDYISQDAVVVVEWASNLPDLFDNRCVSVVITKDMSVSEDFRQITIKGV